MATFNNTDIAAFKGVWVFCEQRQGKLMPTDYELISEARKLADELGVRVSGVLLGDKVEGIARELGGDALVNLIVEESHTCYMGQRGQREPWGYGCGTCPACRLRAAGYAAYAQALAGLDQNCPKG